jgi:polyhydroxyalkanoic acid synthase PhaR subunit
MTTRGSSGGSRPPSDPFQGFRDWLDDAERRWNTFFNEMMSSEQYGQASGRMMEGWLQFQKAVSETLQRSLSTVNLPSRTDLLALSERIGSLESKIESLEHAVRKLGGAPAAKNAAKAKPRRTKKAPRKG